ncbi:MAG: hypothetical protein V4697_01810 [Patescibacteria group bacterium]
MKNLYVLTVIAGLSFGIWPLVMNRSGLHGNIASIVLATSTMLCVLPFSFGKLGALGQTNWWLAITAGIMSAIGITAFNSMLSRVNQVDVSTFLALMVLVQVSCPVIHQLIAGDGFSVVKGCGFALAAIAALLLIKG